MRHLAYLHIHDINTKERCSFRGTPLNGFHDYFNLKKESKKLQDFVFYGAFLVLLQADYQNRQ